MKIFGKNFGIKIAVVTVAVIAAFWLSSPTMAQRETVRSLSGRIDLIVKDLDAIKRYLAHEDVETGGFQQTGGTESRAQAAEIQVRINTIEVELQNLTGQVEGATYQIRQMSDRLEKLLQDVDFRLSAIERGSLAGAAPAIGGETVAAVAAVPEQAAPDPRAALADLSAQELYDAGRARLRGEDYGEAEIAFEEFVNRYPDHELTSNAQYWLGHSFYQRRDFENAARAFLGGYESHGDSPKGPDSLIKLGMSLFALGQKEDACAVYREFGTRYPAPERRLADLLTAESRRAGCS